MNKLFFLITALLVSLNMLAQETTTCYQSMDPTQVNQEVPGSAPVIDSLGVFTLGEDSMLVSFDISSVCYPVVFHNQQGDVLGNAYQDGPCEIRLPCVRSANGQYPYWFIASNTRGKTVESKQLNQIRKK